MTDDLVQRLRDWDDKWREDAKRDAFEAAERIEELEAEIERLRSIIREIADKVSSSPFRASYPDLDANQIIKEIGNDT
jgi:archaellum component FlaC